MGRRRNLIHRSYRQSWLARDILARQPLVSRMAKYQLLAQVLGFDEGSAAIPEQASFLPVPGFDWEQPPASLLQGLVFRAPFTEKMSDELEAAAVSFPMEGGSEEQIVESAEANDFKPEAAAVSFPAIHRPEEQIVESAEANDFKAEVAAVSFPVAEGPEEHFVESEKGNDFEREVAAVSFPAGEGLSQQIVESTEASDFKPEVPVVSFPAGEGPDEHIVEWAKESDLEREPPALEHKDDSQSDEFNEVFRVEIQQEQESMEGPAQSVQAKPSRGRIEEAPFSARHVQPLPTSPSSSLARRNRQVTKDVQHKDTPAEKTGGEEGQANELFAPRDTDRSPQAWMARLMGTSDTATSQAALPSMTSDTKQKSEQAQVMSKAPSPSGQLLPHSGSGSATQQLRRGDATDQA